MENVTFYDDGYDLRIGSEVYGLIIDPRFTNSIKFVHRTIEPVTLTIRDFERQYKGRAMFVVDEGRLSYRVVVKYPNGDIEAQTLRYPLMRCLQLAVEF